MSNAAVGAVYAKIIEDVLEASQVDFEEGGVDQNTLEKLREIWQDKLSSIKVAQFPWDPTPPAATSSASQHPNPTIKTQAPSGNATTTQTPPVPQPPMKTEPTQPKPQPAPYTPQMSSQSMANMTAQQRAAAALQEKFGHQAAGQVAQLQGQASHGQRTGLPQGAASPQGDVKPTLASLQQAQFSSSLEASQTDGSGDTEALADWKAEVARRRAVAAAHPGEGDRLLREHFLATQQRLEAGGLLMPLEERYQAKTSVKRKVNDIARPSSAAATEQVATATQALPTITQYDGADDDDIKDEDDEDAINSDLDDPDELAGDPDADAETDQAMLCTYDKVQRVKNKWKCTLKDGILKVDGKEYVFHKGQGEFEW